MEDDSRNERPAISVETPSEQPKLKAGAEFTAAGDGVTAVFDTRRSDNDRLRAFRRGEGISLAPDAISNLLETRSRAATAVFRQIVSFRDDLAENGFLGTIPVTLATPLRGEILNPDGRPGERLIVEVLRPDFTDNEGVGEFSWPVRKVVTDKRGKFSVGLPPLRVPQNGLRIRIRGHNALLTHAVSRVDALDGDLGLVVLERTLTPLQQSVVGELADLFPVDESDADDNIDDFTTQQPPVVLGEGDCASEYRKEGGTISRHRYSVLFRLIDPLVGPKTITRDRVIGGSTFPVTVPSHAFARAGFGASDMISALGSGGGDWNFRDRVPIEEPLDVDEYFEDLETEPLSVPKASSLGLGYIARMRSVAVHAGMSLGRLVYSLPLAPGEEQRIVVTEQRESLTVQERESLSFSEQQEFEEGRDTSFDSTFSTALSEMINGSSRFNTSSRSKSKGFSGGVGGGIGGFIGGFFGGIAGGAGWTRGSASSSSSGSSSASQNTARSFLSDTHEGFSSSLERSASVKRRSSRTGIRTATARDRQTATTRFVANRNHCHALTMQWFEALRDFSIETRVEGVQLVCFVPLQLIPFRRSGMPHGLPQFVNRAFLLQRYRMLMRHASTLRKEFIGRRRRRSALDLLEAFAADPTAQPQNVAPTAQDVIRFEVSGVFMTNDDISVAVFTKDGDRIGPTPLAGSPVDIDAALGSEAANRDALIARLASVRDNVNFVTTYEGAVALPLAVDRSDIARIEVRRRTGRFSYRFAGGGDVPTTAEIVSDVAKNTEEDIDLARVARDIDRVLNTSLSGREFDDLVGAPVVNGVTAVMNEGQPDETTVLSDANPTPLTPALPYPVDATNEVLSRRDLRKIEEMYQHVVSNTVPYSKSVWESMTDEERAILLERFTIGVPEGGLVDPSSEVPLLSAVANRVLGFFGNAMIMPFHIPPDLEDSMEVTTGDIQDGLMRFHREDFRPPRRTISLPTRGLLGEAVLGRCNACETIDHRRFWNWQDSPTPPPVGDTPTLPAEGGPIFTARAPFDLASNQPQNLLTIAGGDVGTGSALPTSQLSEILKAAPELARGGADLTGLKELQKQLQAETESVAQGRDKAIDTATDLTKDLVGKATELAGKAQELKADKKEKEEKAEKDKKASEQASSQKAFTEFSGQAGALSALTGSQDEGDREAFATQLLGSLPGGTEALGQPANVLTLAKIFGAFGKVNNKAEDGSNEELGSAAFLSVLGGLGG